MHKLERNLPDVRRRRKNGAEKGAIAVEFVLMLPVVLALIIGSVYFRALFSARGYASDLATISARICAERASGVAGDVSATQLASCATSVANSVNAQFVALNYDICPQLVIDDSQLTAATATAPSAVFSFELTCGFGTVLSAPGAKTRDDWGENDFEATNEVAARGIAPVVSLR